MTRLTIVACVLTLLGAPLLNAPIVHAQEKFAAPTEAQVQLYSKALDAIANNNFEEAIDLLKSSLALGELNIIYLNLGRAYFRNGQCNEAEKAFDKVASAPKVAEPSPDVIGQTLDEFRAELTQCPGTVVVTCKPASLTVSIDGSAPVACSESPFVVAPGEHTITGADGELRAEARVAVESRKPTSVVLDATPDEPPPPPPPEGMSGLSITGLALAGVGVATLTTGVIIDQTTLSSAIDDYSNAVETGASNESTLRDDAESLQSTVLILYIGGGVALATGATLFAVGLLGGDDDQAQASEGGQVTPWVTPGGGAGVGWSATW